MALSVPEFLFGHKLVCVMYRPVGEKGTDEVFGILRHFYILWEDERVLVVHDLAISSHQGLGIEGSFTWE